MPAPRGRNYLALPMLQSSIHHIPPQDIDILRESRQRKDIDTTNIEESIARIGIINPIIITPAHELVAGERRLATALKLSLPTVPVRYTTDLSPSELRLIELDENLRRAELPWQDRVRAVQEMYKLYQIHNPGGDKEAFAASIGYKITFVKDHLQAAEELARPTASAAVLNAPSMRKAANVISRTRERSASNAIADVVDALVSSKNVEPASSPVVKSVRSPEHDILNESFLDWAPLWTGPRFNLLHCDFPYGIDLDKSDQLQAGEVAHQRLQTYSDSEEIYWTLLDCLAINADKLLSSSAHIVFWFSMKHYDATKAFFRSRMPQIEWDDFPLIWHKTDNKGIAPDVGRQPRRVYETALFGRIGDRKNVKLISNAYGAPKANSDHPSEKPVPVLRHFLSMVTDEHTRLLDPTCGSGSSLRASESLGASAVLGLEIDTTFSTYAREQLKRQRSMALLTGGK